MSNKTVKITFIGSHTPNGMAILKDAKPIIKKVQHHYINGKISDSSGSVWSVAPNPNSKESTYITVRD